MNQNSKENNIKIQFDTNPDDTQIIYADQKDIVESMLAPQDIVLISRIEDDVIVHVNQPFLSRLKRTYDDVINKKLNDISFLSDEDEQNRFLEILKKSNQFNSFETYITRSDGFRFPVILSGGIIQFNDEECLFLVVRDISPIKLAEKNLKESDIKYRTLFEQTKAAILLENSKSEIIDSNVAAAELFGFSQEELSTMKISDLLFRKEQEGKETDYSSDLKEQIAKDKNGKTFWIESSTTPLEMDGSLLYLTMVRNINEKRKLEDQLQQAAKMEAVGRLTGSVAHDFNNVLTIIQGFSELALSTIHKEDSAYNYLIEINKAAIKAESLIRQLLTFSRKHKQSLSIININELISNLKKLIERVIGENIELEFDIPNALFNIKADPNQIEQIILNLIVNARDAMPNKGKLTIKTEKQLINVSSIKNYNVKRQGKYILLYVKDNGLGIDSNLKNHIFEPFFTTKDRDKGTGLGLATVRRIIKRLGGGISVDSQPNQGTTFCICLPEKKDKTELIDRIKNQKNKLVGNETILVVEDQDELRNVVSQALKMHGYNVVESNNGSDALEICKRMKHTINLVLTDVIMPNMSGRELVEYVKAKYPYIKYLFMSGYNEEIIGKHGALFSSKTFIQKPFTPPVLLKKIRDILSDKS